jgi:fructose-bisphosphate aldolase class I
LQDTALKAWGGKPANFTAGQRELSKRARLNGLAATGAYTPDMESQAA